MNIDNKKIIYVTIVGAPNVGKSSLVNYLTNYYACTISPKGHTTKESVYAIVNVQNCQIIFVDTPGLSKENSGVYGRYNSIVNTECNIIKDGSGHILLFLFESHRNLPIHIHEFINKYKDKYKIAVMTKIDKPHKDKYLENTMMIKDHFNDVFITSTLTGKGMDDLLQHIISKATDGEWQFAETFKTNISLKKIIENKIRESLFTYLHNEIPHFIKIEYTVKDNIYEVTLLCTSSQKPIVLGVIKDISMLARKNIESILKTKIHLYTYVKLI